jgi:hypothetical protein
MIAKVLPNSCTARKEVAMHVDAFDRRIAGSNHTRSPPFGATTPIAENIHS